MRAKTQQEYDDAMVAYGAYRKEQKAEERRRFEELDRLRPAAFRLLEAAVGYVRPRGQESAIPSGLVTPQSVEAATFVIDQTNDPCWDGPEYPEEPDREYPPSKVVIVADETKE